MTAVTKRKEDHPATEVEITPTIRELLANSSEEEIATDGVATSRPPMAEDFEMDESLFEKLVESVREAGAILRGEKEAARRTRLVEADDSTEGCGHHGEPGSDDSDPKSSG